MTPVATKRGSIEFSHRLSGFAVGRVAPVCRKRCNIHRRSEQNRREGADLPKTNMLVGAQSGFVMTVGVQADSRRMFGAGDSDYGRQGTDRQSTAAKSWSDPHALQLRTPRPTAPISALKIVSP